MYIFLNCCKSSGDFWSLTFKYSKCEEYLQSYSFPLHFLLVISTSIYLINPSTPINTNTYFRTSKPQKICIIDFFLNNVCKYHKCLNTVEETVQKGKAITEICNYRKTGKKKHQPQEKQVVIEMRIPEVSDRNKTNVKFNIKVMSIYSLNQISRTLLFTALFKLREIFYFHKQQGSSVGIPWESNT